MLFIFSGFFGFGRQSFLLCTSSHDSFGHCYWIIKVENNIVYFNFILFILGINFPNVVNAAESVTIENDGISEIDEDRLHERLNVIAENFRTAHSTRAFSGENIY